MLWLSTSIAESVWTTNKEGNKIRNKAHHYLLAVFTVVGLTALCFPLSQYLRPANLAALFLLLICWLASRVGRGPSVLASALGVLCFDYYFIPPRFAFRQSDTEYLLTFVALLAVSLGISGLTAKACEQAEAALQRERETLALLEFSRALTGSVSAEEIQRLTEETLAQKFGLQVRFCLDNGVVETAETSPAQKRLMEAFSRQAMLALEREKYARLAQQAEVSRAAEQLQSTLLSTVSHDLRSPLVSIQGALLTLQSESQNPLAAADREALLQNAIRETDRLNRFVANLMQMNRLESGHLELRLEPQEVSEVAESTLALVRHSARVKVDLSRDLPPVKADFVLLQQALWNVLDNALKFSSGPVHLGAELLPQGLELWVRDFGPGIPEAERELVFQRFYRGQAKVRGSGLGLPICRGLVQAMGGDVWLEPTEPGIRVRMRLQLAEMQVNAPKSGDVLQARA